jgi:uncharacterized protein (DUF488 family)
MANPFFTIGHSDRTLAEFASLLAECAVGLVVDVRSIPRSRSNPQFNLDRLPETLNDVEIAYVHLAALGGRRGRRQPAGEDRNGYWRVAGFRNYADYAQGPEFQLALAELRRLGHERRAAIMCAEAVWWRCHRRIIADYLLAADERVFHILGRGHVDEASLTPGARVDERGIISYPPSAP